LKRPETDGGLVAGEVQHVADNVMKERHLAVHGQAVQDLHGEGLDWEGGRAAAGQGRHTGGRGRPSSHRLHQRQHRGLEQILHTTRISASTWQGFGSGLDPDSIRSVDPDPDPFSESGSGSRRAKMIHKSRKKIKKFHVLKCWMFCFES
jgi:hypothetical protein